LVISIPFQGAQQMPIKFFPKDVKRGQANKAGDRFWANFFDGLCEFVVIEHCGQFFMAEMA
jgi:hypothetical protein